jgi:ubiquinone/menaquinone biosynthesis C-methylase UbiE
MIVDHVAALVFHLTAEQPPDKHLDMGAGWGHLIQRLRTRLPALKSWGLDYNPTHFPLADVPIAHADFSWDWLPFEDDKFDLVTCTEVFEHLDGRTLIVSGRKKTHQTDPLVPIARPAQHLP